MNRPGGVTAIAVLSLILAALNLGEAALSEGPNFGGSDDTSPSLFALLFWILLRLGSSAWNAANGIGLLRLKNWARLSTMTLVVCGVVVGSIGALRALLSQHFAFAIIELAVVAIGLWIVDFLMRPRVKAQFLSRTAMKTSQPAAPLA